MADLSHYFHFSPMTKGQREGFAAEQQSCTINARGHFSKVGAHWHKSLNVRLTEEYCTEFLFSLYPAELKEACGTGQQWQQFPLWVKFLQSHSEWAGLAYHSRVRLWPLWHDWLWLKKKTYIAMDKLTVHKNMCDIRRTGSGFLWY